MSRAASSSPPPRLRTWRRVGARDVATFRVFDVSRLELEDAGGKPRGDAYVCAAATGATSSPSRPRTTSCSSGSTASAPTRCRSRSRAASVDPGETPEQAALRELREETGYEADSVEPLLDVEPNPAIQNNRCLTFVARGARAVGGHEVRRARGARDRARCPVGALEDLLDGGQVTHALMHGALETFWRRGRGNTQSR